MPELKPACPQAGSDPPSDSFSRLGKSARSLYSVPQSSCEPLQILRRRLVRVRGPAQDALDPKMAPVEMAWRLSKFHGLDFRPYNRRGPVERRARNSSPPLTHASAKLTRRTDILFRNGGAVWNRPLGYLEGEVLGQVVGRRCKLRLFSGVL